MRRCIGDLEANGLLPTVTKIWCGVFKDIDTGEIFKFHSGMGDDWGMEMLAFMDDCSVLIMHNGHGYDWPLLEMLCGYEYKGYKIDTLVLSRLLSPNRMRPWGFPGNSGPHSVDAYGYLFGRYKPVHDDWSKYSPEMLHRCSEDVEIQHRIYVHLIDEAKKLGGDWSRPFETTQKLFEIIAKQEAHGWLVDQDHLAKSIHMCVHWMDRIAKVLAPRLPMVIEISETKTKGTLNYVRKPFLKSGKHNRHVCNYWEDDVYVVVGPHSRVTFRPTNLDKAQEVKQYLLDSGWIPLAWNSNDAGERTSPKLSKDDPFDGIQGSMGRLIAKRVQAKQRKGILEGWERRLRPDGRLPSRISGLAATGRAKHAEIVNVPNCDSFFGRWMRKVFTCPDDMVLVSTDAASCQDRMLAQRAKDDSFTEMLLNGDKSKGTDGHSLAMKAVNKVHRAVGLDAISRGKAKNYNFAFKFGASDNKLGAMSSSTEATGSKIREELRKEFHAQADVVDVLEREWRTTAKTKLKKITTKSGLEMEVESLSNGHIIGLDGRPIYIESPHAILVYMLQSDEAIMMAEAYVKMYEKFCEKFIWGVDFAIISWYHDEITIECKPEIADEVGKIQEECIRDAGLALGLKYCPQQGEYAIGRNWSEIH